MSAIDDIKAQGLGGARLGGDDEADTNAFAERVESLILGIVNERIAAGDTYGAAMLERIARNVTGGFSGVYQRGYETGYEEGIAEAQGEAETERERSKAEILADHARQIIATEQRFAGLVAWLCEERIAYRDRCGPPTLDDLRACGVTTRQIREYLRRAGWQCETRDTGDAHAAAWSRTPPEWLSPDRKRSVGMLGDDHTIAEIAAIEDRSPWAVLDDCAWHAGERTIHRDGVAVAWIRGSEISPA